MIEKKFLQKLQDDYRANESQRRQIISASNDILFNAKKTIFALQRQNFDEAKTKLDNNHHQLQDLAKHFGTERLRREGAYRAAVEEYLEGKTFYLTIKKQAINPENDLSFNYEAYLGAVCDLIGEMVRWATNQAAAGKFNQAVKIKKSADDLMSQLIDFDFTGYLRTKYDQARGHLRKLEQITYDIKLHQKD